MKPAVSIGVPVFNGANRLPDSLNNIRGQTFSEFEVIISDNGSTDGSAEIAEKFCDDDPRFHLIRQPSNMGALHNFQAVVEAANADRFLWRADDDLSSLNYVGTLNFAMDQAPDALLAVGRRVQLRIGCGKRRVTASRLPTATDIQHSPVDLLRTSNPGWFYGMMQTGYARTTIHKVIDEFSTLWGWDHLMIFPAIAMGRVTGAEDAIFFHRLEKREETEAKIRGPAANSALHAKYLAFCERRIEETGLAAADQAPLRKAVLRHMRRVL